MLLNKLNTDSSGLIDYTGFKISLENHEAQVRESGFGLVQIFIALAIDDIQCKDGLIWPMDALTVRIWCTRNRKNEKAQEILSDCLLLQIHEDHRKA